MLSRENLHDYQHRAIDFVMRNKRAALWLDMGLGKTATSATILVDLIDSLSVNKALIIAPLRVANSTWHKEFGNWLHTKHLRYSIVTGSVKNRQSALMRQADVYIVNRENVGWLVELYGKKWPFEAVIIDESSSFKSSKSQRFKALKKVNSQIDYMVQLTGTPSPNGYLDLWSQLYLLDSGKRLGRTFSEYRRRFFTSDYMGFKYELAEGAKARIDAAISDIVISMSAEDYLELPQRIDLVESVELPAVALTAYRELERDMVLQLRDAEISASQAAVLAGKLLQGCNGAWYDEAKVYHEIHNAKLDALAELIEDNPSENLLVAYSFKSDLDRLKKRFPAAVVLDTSADTIDRWNNGEIKMLLAHPACLHPSTEVLTEKRGWVKITDVRLSDRIHDGVEFVNHDGCQFSGVKPVINVYGIKMTTDHKLLIGGEWVRARDVRNIRDSKRKAQYNYKGDDSYLVEMFNLRGGRKNTEAKRGQGESYREGEVSSLRGGIVSPNDKHPHMVDMAPHEIESNQQKGQGLPKLRGTWYRYVRKMVTVRAFLRGYAPLLQRWVNPRTRGQQQGLLEVELCMGNQQRTTIKQTHHKKVVLQRRGYPFGRSLPPLLHWTKRSDNAIEQRDDTGRSTGRLQEFNISEKTEISEVYDIVNCGSRNRFLIRNSDGEVFVSHNSAGHGLNLQKGGSVIVWFGLTWSLELYQQFNARLHRQGQTKPVRIIHLVAHGCKDEQVVEVLSSKAKTQDELLAAVKK